MGASSNTSSSYVLHDLNRLDGWIAALTGCGALALYARTMAPDILYGDSAELQTLAYTLGHTHSTGYPIYLLLARLVGLLPLNSPAWRVTFFSALMAGLAAAGVYLLSRQLTNSRAGAWLACLGLILSYTLWSQAVITEVYAPGAAFLVWILVLVLRWQQNPEGRTGTLFVAGLLAGLSPGMHATTALAALPAGVFVPVWLAWQRADRRAWQRALIAGGAGAVAGLAVWLVAFVFVDLHNPPSSFIRTTLYPHRSIWGLTPEDMDSSLERIWLTVNSVQWKDVLFAGGADAGRASLVTYLSDLPTREFSLWYFLLGLYGWWVLLPRFPWRGVYLLASYGFLLFYVLNYHPGDQYVFFLSTYLPFAAVTGVGAGAVIEGLSGWKVVARRGWSRAVSTGIVLLLLVLVLQPHWTERVTALQNGVASFVWEDYQFPVGKLREPRILANMMLLPLPQDALVLMDWRELYAVAYLAYVEEKKPGILLAEALPRGNDGKVSASMVEEIHLALAAGRPVFAAQRYAGLEEHFRLAVASNRFVQIFEKK